MAVPDRRVVLAADHLTKDFPGLRALDDVSLRVRAGEIVALLGQNGSGKSTLVKILAGVYTADAGTATHGSLHFIHQDLGLIPALSTVENLALGERGLAPVRRRKERAHARELIRRFGVDFDVLAPISELTPAQRTIVAIARAMDGWTGDEHVLVLDEPTASLHRGEVGVLFAAVREVARSGAGVMFISHRLDEVTALADRVLVLRDGRLVEDVPAAGLTAGELAYLITGKRSSAVTTGPEARSDDEPLLRVRGLAGASVQDLDLDLRRGEVLGIAGSLGSGREHVAGLLFGSLPRRAGAVEIDGRSLGKGTALRHGMALVPADRRADGGVMTMNVRENLTLPDLPRFRRFGGRLSLAAERAAAAEWCTRVGLRPMLPERELGLFSGGNQQKAVIARWLRIAPAVLLVEEPTQGVDIGAGEAIRQLILDAAGDGMAVLVSSSDNADLIRMCGRVLVLRDGRLATELTGPAIDDHRLTEECLGATKEPHHV